MTKRTMSAAEVREALTGPDPSLSTPFCRDGSIDVKGVRKFIDFVIEEGGAKCIVMTHGDTLYTLLTDDEIAKPPRLVVEHTAKRAMVVAADHAYWTGKAVEFAKYCRDVGADVLMV